MRGAALVAAACVLAATAGGLEGISSASVHAKPLCLGKPATIVGSGRSEDIIGTPRADVIAGLGGSDAISGFDLSGGTGGRDLICGGPGNDFLDGWGGDDVIDGGPGRDVCEGAQRAVRCEDTRTRIYFQTGLLRAGSYVVDAFRPQFGFRVGAGWSLPLTPLPTQTVLSRRGEPGGLSVTFDSFYSQRSVADTIARLSRIPGLRASGSAAATIGGARGRRVDLRVTASKSAFVRGTERYELEAGHRARAYAVRVLGKTVLIIVEAPANDFRSFAAEFQQVLESVRWS